MRSKSENRLLWQAPFVSEDYEREVRERMETLRGEFPDGNYPSPYSEHETGECVECDATRRLMWEPQGEGDGNA